MCRDGSASEARKLACLIPNDCKNGCVHFLGRRMHSALGATTASDELTPIETLLRAKARGSEEDFSGFLTSIRHDGLVTDTQCTAHTHFISLGPTGIPRTRDLVLYLASKIVDFAIPRDELQKAHQHFAETGSARLFGRLTQEAKSLFTDSSSSGELGELLLFCLAEAVLKLPRLLCKMPLKTNSRVHVHGSDAIHVGVEEGRLSLYWGESKLHTKFSDAARYAIRDLGKLLTYSEREPNLFRRDLLLIQRHIDVDQENLASILLDHLNPDGSKFIDINYCGLALIGFDYEKYPAEHLLLRNDDFSKIVEEETRSWRRSIGRRVVDEALCRFSIHAFCVPFPSISEFKSLFNKELGITA